MKVSELIEYLRTINKNAEVCVTLVDGRAILRVKVVAGTKDQGATA